MIQQIHHNSSPFRSILNIDQHIIYSVVTHLIIKSYKQICSLQNICTAKDHEMISPQENSKKP